MASIRIISRSNINHHLMNHHLLITSSFKSAILINVRAQNLVQHQISRNVMSVSSRWPFNAMTKKRMVFAGSFTLATAFILGFDLLESGFKRLRSTKTKECPPVGIEMKATSMPDIKVSRSISGPTKLDMKLTLFQYQTCPFCTKVRVFLDYYGIPYDIIEVNPVMRKQIKWSNYKKVPILVAHKKGEEDVLQMNDSSVIISALSSYLLSRDPKSRHSKETLSSITPWYQSVKITNDEGMEVNEIINKYFLMFGDIDPRKYKEIETEIATERQWRKWADDVLVHTLSPNIYRTFNESLKSFKHFSIVGEWEENMSWWERMVVIYVGSTAMLMVGKKLKRKYNLKDDVRQSLYDSVNHWRKYVKLNGANKTFMGGERPNLADLAVYGVLNSIEGCDAFDDVLKQTKIKDWYFNMQDMVKNHAGHEHLILHE